MTVNITMFSVILTIMVLIIIFITLLQAFIVPSIFRTIKNMTVFDVCILTETIRGDVHAIITSGTDNS